MTTSEPATAMLLTAREVADYLGLSSESILRWTRRGELPAIKLPSGAIRYRPAQIEQWLAARELQNDDGRAGNAAEVRNLAGAGGGDACSS